MDVLAPQAERLFNVYGSSSVAVSDIQFKHSAGDRVNQYHSITIATLQLLQWKNQPIFRLDVFPYRIVTAPVEFWDKIFRTL